MEQRSVEYISDNDGHLLAIVIYHDHEPPDTEFVTTSELNLQVGFVKYPEDGYIQPHIHLPIERHLEGTNEVLFVRSGKMDVFLFDSERQFMKKRVLSQGDVLILTGGGHGFRMLEDTVLLEVKQGPYTGLKEKERFDYDPGQ